MCKACSRPGKYPALYLADIKVSCREGQKAGKPRWLAPIPKPKPIVDYRLPYYGGWTPSSGHTSCSLPQYPQTNYQGRGSK